MAPRAEPVSPSSASATTSGAAVQGASNAVWLAQTIDEHAEMRPSAPRLYALHLAADCEIGSGDMIELAILTAIADRLTPLLASPPSTFHPLQVDGCDVGYLDDARARRLVRFSDVFRRA